ncbi:hypothetical protein FNH05_17405 [Amycolatopsis rhizosphaerae]|uniref:Uncharacterized protein n=1 Tax=Amycolatopsis rhizosphaerae TaxID=2053003 RepID=A0A558CJB8_9PSEU|nr:hypothetical protein [Amycolatopsis rhizosphaerae]TVT48868.1 hypothetical protein FNH05_17405 [Amycolatopsis rhizosphaerae]
MPKPSDEDYRQQYERVKKLLDRLAELAENMDDFETAAVDIVRADVVGICELTEPDERDFLQSLASAGQFARSTHRIVRSYLAELCKAMDHEGIRLPTAVLR